MQLLFTFYVVPKTEKSEKAEKAEKTEQAEQAEKAEKTEKTEQSEKTEPAEEGAETEQNTEQPNQEGAGQENSGEQSEEKKDEQNEEGEGKEAGEGEGGEGEGETVPSAVPSEDSSAQEPVLVKRTFKLSLKISVESLGVKNLNSTDIRKSESRLTHFDFLDQQRKDLQKEKNNLEAYIYDTRDKLSNEDVIESSTEEEREILSALLSAASDWLDENADTASIYEYRSQSKTLKDKADKIYFRIKERKTFPKAVVELLQSIQTNRDILQNITELLNVTEEDRDGALNNLEGIALWLQEKQLQQIALPKHLDPVVTTDELSRKKAEIELKTKILLRKPKKKKPVEAKPEVILEEETEQATEQTGTEHAETKGTEAEEAQKEGNNQQETQTEQTTQKTEKTKDTKGKSDDKKVKDKKGGKEKKADEKKKEFPKDELWRKL